MEEKNVREEKLKDKTCEAVDDLGTTVKEASRKIFDAMAERTAEVFSDLFDSITDKAKEKIKKRGNDGKKDDSVPDGN